jgi:hypothetical protein
MTSDLPRDLDWFMITEDNGTIVEEVPSADSKDRSLPLHFGVSEMLLVALTASFFGRRNRE